jgi:hypothetical protein
MRPAYAKLIGNLLVCHLTFRQQTSYFSNIFQKQLDTRRTMVLKSGKRYIYLLTSAPSHERMQFAHQIDCPAPAHARCKRVFPAASIEAFRVITPIRNA